MVVLVFLQLRYIFEHHTINLDNMCVQIEMLFVVSQNQNTIRKIVCKVRLLKTISHDPNLKNQNKSD